MFGPRDTALATTLPSIGRTASPWLAVGLAAVVAWTSYQHNARAVGIADTYGYVSQAELMTQGRLTFEEPLIREVPWPSADWSFAPLGYRPAARRGFLAPTYAPGLPAVLALFVLAGGRDAVFLATPIFAGLTVLVAYLVGARLGRLTGLLGAVWLALSPAFVFMTALTMSDIPVTMWWLLAALGVGSRGRRAPWLAGLAAAMAVLTRPNLAPLVVPLGVYLAAVWWSAGARREAVVRTLSFAIAPAVAAGVIVWMNHALYGSTVETGYGSPGGLFGLAHALPNLSRYPRWLASAETPLVFLCLAAPWVARRAGPRGADARATVRLWLSMIGIVWLSYVFYLVFDDWWYVRFLLPALPLMLSLSVYVAVALSARWLGPGRRALALLAVVPFVWWQAQIGANLLTTDFRAGERKYPAVAQYLARTLPPGGIVVSVQHSGSVRYYEAFSALRWDWLGRGWLDAAVEFLEGQGRDARIVLEEWEVPLFRDRFADRNALGRLDWPPAAEFDREHASRVLVYDPRDRARSLAGETIVTADIPDLPH